MAVFTVNLRILVPVKIAIDSGVTSVPIITDQRVALRRNIHAPGVAHNQKVKAGTSSTYYAWDDGTPLNEDFPYYQLSTSSQALYGTKSTAFPVSYSTPLEQTIAGFATSAVANSQMRNSTVTAQFTAWYIGAPIGPATVRCEIYSVDSSYVETLVKSYTETISNTITNYTESITFSATFPAYLLVKYIARDDGV